ncbi:MAG TPA: hypothetical protein VK656_06650, partial [Candidatus Acidoferrum sp.]|nr:hypothetical protein [Candidatus Acidoferrum sp.]
MTGPTRPQGAPGGATGARPAGGPPAGMPPGGAGPRRPGGPGFGGPGMMGRGMMPAEKSKDFRGSFRRLIGELRP